MILFQIEINARNIKETTLARYFIKVTARPSFTRLRVIKCINRVQIEFIKYENRKYSVVSLSYLNLLDLPDLFKIITVT